MVFSFPVVDVYEDGSFQQYAYGEVVISGLPENDTAKRIPLTASVVERRIGQESAYHLLVYTPEKCVQYNGAFYGFEESSSEYYDVAIGVDGHAEVFGYILETAGAGGVSYSAHITQHEPSLGNGIVAKFPIASVSGVAGVTNAGDANVPRDDKAMSSVGRSATTGGTDEAKSRSGTTGTRKCRTLVRPFCITAFDTPHTDPLANRVLMFLPNKSLTINSESVDIAMPSGIEKCGDFVPLTVGTWWCVVENSSSLGFSAHIEKSADKPSGDSVEYVFKIAEIYDETFRDGAFQEFVCGEVTMSRPNIKRLTPFDVQVVAAYDSSGLVHREIKCYTPTGRTLQFGGAPVDIEGASGDWTNIALPEDGFVVLCCLKEKGSPRARIVTSIKEFAWYDLDFAFPIAAIALGNNESSRSKGKTTQNWIKPKDWANEFTKRLKLGDDDVLDELRWWPRALLVIVGNTKYNHRLSGPEQDAQYMYKLWQPLVRIYPNMIELENEEATHDNVLKSLKRTVDLQYPPKKGYNVNEVMPALVYFAAHGLYEDGVSSMEMYDETLYDYEIWEVLSKAKRPVFIIFDSCHSEKMMRPESEEDASSEEDESSEEDDLHILCWSACQKDESAHARDIDGGSITKRMFEHLQSVKPKDAITYEHLWGLVKEGVKSDMQSVGLKQNPVATQIGTWYDHYPM